MLNKLILVCRIIHNMSLFMRYGTIILSMFEFFLLLCEHNVNIIIFNSYFIHLGMLCLYNMLSTFDLREVLNNNFGRSKVF